MLEYIVKSFRKQLAAHARALIPSAVIVVLFCLYWNIDRIAPGLRPRAKSNTDPQIQVSEQDAKVDLADVAKSLEAPSNDADTAQAKAEFERENQEKLKQSELRLTELRSVYLSPEQKLAQEALEKRFKEAAPDKSPKPNELLKKMIENSPDHGLFLSGETAITTVKGAKKIRLLFSIHPETASPANIEEEISAVICWKLQAKIEGTAIAAQSGSCAGDFRYGESGAPYLLGDFADPEEGELEAVYFAVAIPNIGANSSQFEIVQNIDQRWLSATIQWRALSKTEFEQAVKIFTP